MTIGLRASPTEVTFAVYESTERRVVNVEEVVIPAAFEWPERLKFIRSNLLDILRDYGVTSAGIRLAEPTPDASPDLAQRRKGSLVIA